jgi:hypothetical protein
MNDRCGEFYNTSTLTHNYGIKAITSDVGRTLSGQVCNGCFRKFHVSETRICYPTGTEFDQDQEFGNLAVLSGYTTEQAPAAVHDPFFDPLFEFD